MSNLKVLIVGAVHFSIGPEHLPDSLRVLDWSGYPSPSLPSDFHPNELLLLSLPNSCLKLDKPLKMFGSLGFMDFEDCKFLIQVPNLSGLPNLRALCLDNCTSLIKVDDSIGFLDKLGLLSAQGCIKLDTLVPAINLPSLETLDLRWCTSLQCFPDVLGIMENIREAFLDHTAIKELPPSFCMLVRLERLYLRRCPNLRELPGGIGAMPNLEVIFFYKQRGFRLFEPPKDQGAVVFGDAFFTVTLDVPNFVSSIFQEGCSSAENAILPEGRIHVSNGSSVSFWCRKRFPVVFLLLSWEPIGRDLRGSVLEFRVCVLINGTFQISSSRVNIYYGAEAVVPICVTISGPGLTSTIQSDVVRGAFSVHEWIHIEVSCELKCHMPYDAKWVSGGQSRSIAVPIKQSILLAAKQVCCVRDIKFADSDGEDIICDKSCYCNNTSCFGELDSVKLFFEKIKLEG